ncbi:MAG TPA: hypothetical protein VFQ53_13965 [Kofleriaceae bacterium]|nr:hypothetical protein [Kofleriaceae bacterium]
MTTRTALAFALLVACRGESATQPDARPPGDGQATDALRPDAPPFVDKSGPCVGTFGSDLPNGFGRLDGTIVAVLAPGNTTCARPNDTHMIIEVRSGGEVYRMVVAVVSAVGNPDMALAERDAALSGPAWSDGFHLDAPLDYVQTLDLHRLDFTATPMSDLVAIINDQLELGARVSVYATVEDIPDSAHLIHRNQTNQDGAIVIDPDTAPHYLLLRFDNQLF